MTARRLPAAGRAETSAAGVRRRSWKRDALEALMTRLAVDCEIESEAVMSGRRSLRQIAQRFIDLHAGDEPESFVRTAYEVFLGRGADAGGLAFYTKRDRGRIPRSNTVDCLLASKELEDTLRREVGESAS